jgi:hypothetical protein
MALCAASGRRQRRRAVFSIDNQSIGGGLAIAATLDPWKETMP